MILIIDNYDSFVYNLAHYLHEVGATARVVRNDALTAQEAINSGAKAIILSPGPGTPQTAGICMDVVKNAPADLPILGVCLGHQAITAALGGDVIPAEDIVHGKQSTIRHDATGVFAQLPSPMTVTRYHSLVVPAQTLPEDLRVCATTDDGTVMALAHTHRPVHGVQFHPESIASEHGHALMKNFVEISRP